MLSAPAEFKVPGIHAVIAGSEWKWHGDKQDLAPAQSRMARWYSPLLQRGRLLMISYLAELVLYGRVSPATKRNKCRPIHSRTFEYLLKTDSIQHRLNFSHRQKRKKNIDIKKRKKNKRKKERKEEIQVNDWCLFEDSELRLNDQFPKNPRELRNWGLKIFGRIGGRHFVLCAAEKPDYR